MRLKEVGARRTLLIPQVAQRARRNCGKKVITKVACRCAVLIFWGLQVATLSAQALPKTRFVGTNSAVFQNPSGGRTTGVGTNTFTWAEGPTSTNPPSKLAFSGNAFDVTIQSGVVFGPRQRNDREVFSLGKLNYTNLFATPGTISVDLKNTVMVSQPVATSPTDFSFPFQLTTTPNDSDPQASADTVFLPTSFSTAALKAPTGATFNLELVGFGSVTGNGFSTVDRFHVLEGGTAQADLLGRFAPPGEPIVNGAVSVQITGPTVKALFKPNFNLSISEAALISGYDHFNWHQVITADPYPPGGLSVPYVDPPTGGGSAFGGYADSLPFYWDEQGAASSGYHLSNHTTTNTLSYSDTPAEPQLTIGQTINFTTSLAGVLPDGTFDVLYVFNWATDYNGTSGGVSSRRNTNDGDVGSGAGGIRDLRLDLNPEDVPLAVRQVLIADGARNVPLTIVPEPSAIVLLLVGALIACTRTR